MEAFSPGNNAPDSTCKGKASQQESWKRADEAPSRTLLSCAVANKSPIPANAGNHLSILGWVDDLYTAQPPQDPWMDDEAMLLRIDPCIKADCQCTGPQRASSVAFAEESFTSFTEEIKTIFLPY